MQYSTPGEKPTLASGGDRPDLENRVKLGQGSGMRDERVGG